MPKHFEKAIFSQFSAKFGPFLHPQMTRNFQKRRNVVETQLNQPRGTQNNHFLVSPDALEVIVITDSLAYLLGVSTDLTNVTLVRDDCVEQDQ